MIDKGEAKAVVTMAAALAAAMRSASPDAGVFALAVAMCNSSLKCSVERGKLGQSELDALQREADRLHDRTCVHKDGSKR